MVSNEDRIEFKKVGRAMIEHFTSARIKRMSTFGDKGLLVFCSDNLNENTNLVLIKDRGYIHLVSGFKIQLTIRP